MKTFFSTLIGLLLVSSLWAQVPQSFKYQAVARDATGAVIKNQAIGIQMSIVQTSIYGASIYVETFTAQSNEYGLVNVNIGTGNVLVGNFSNIDWSADKYFLKVDMDMTGGSNYLTFNISQLMSVPYALHAKTAESANETDPLYTAWDKSSGITITESQISDLDHFTNADETDPTFAASVASDITQENLNSWNAKLSEEVDGSVTNELQTLSRNGLVITLSNGGGSFHDSIGVYTAGTGIKITNNVVSTKLAIGDSYGGGKIFWLDASGNHGLIADTGDINTGIKWHNTVDTLCGANYEAIYVGDLNTNIIVDKQGNGVYAAIICRNAAKITNNEFYSDWYLPSKYELNLLYQQRNLVGNFTSDMYWSSTEADANKAWAQSFSNGIMSSDPKSVIRRVRAIRAF